MPLIAAGAALIAATYGLVRLAYGLFLPDVQAELGLDAATAGAISSGASLIYCVGALLGFFLASRHSRLLVLGAGLTAGLGAAGMAAASDETFFAIAAVVSSIGAGLASPALVAVVQRNVAPGLNDRAQMIVNAGTGPGLAVAGLLALVLLPNWRSAWFIVAGFTLAVTALILLLDRARAERAADRRSLPGGRWFVDHARLIVAALMMGAGTAAVWTYGRTLLVTAGVDGAVSIVAWIALGAGGAAVILTARVTDRLSPRAIWAISVGAIAVATAALGAFPTLTVAALAACVVFGWGYIVSAGALISWTTRLDAARAPTGTALLFVVIVFGQAVGAAAAGASVQEWGYLATFLLSAAAAAVSIVVAIAPGRGRSATTDV